jgi:hypothetical protein
MRIADATQGLICAKVLSPFNIIASFSAIALSFSDSLQPLLYLLLPRAARHRPSPPTHCAASLAPIAALVGLEIPALRPRAEVEAEGLADADQNAARE